MAAYAALVSLMHIIEQIQHHPRPPISLDKDNVQSLTEKVTFLQDFLGVYSHVYNEEVDCLQSRIADAAYEAEDVIESHIVDQILAQSTTHGEKISSTLDFYRGLQKVIEDMDVIKKEVMEIREKMGSIQNIQLHRDRSNPTGSSLGSPLKGQNIIVGLDDALFQLMDKLTGHQSSRQIIPITGMGGIGKTTLARSAYENPLIVQHFHIHAWATISQEYSVREILSQLLYCLKVHENKENLREKTDKELGEILYQTLFGRRYLIILDDMWSIEAWEKVKFFFPPNNNGSRVIITSRLSNISLHLPSTFGLEMNFLVEELSWNLLCKIVFGEDGCPIELEECGKKIAQNCKGLPLSIVVIGGLLAKSEKTREYWRDIAENLNSIVNLEDNERCFKQLYMSYKHLPVHLKPCFLYIGLFPEDSQICISNLVKLWVAEGFLKPIIGKSLEEVAQEYLKDLIDRNLISVVGWKSNGKMKFCKIHDLLRDLCLKEARKEKFLCVTKLSSFNEKINITRRIAIQDLQDKYCLFQIHDPSQLVSLVRSFTCESPIVLANFKLLRVLNLKLDDAESNIFLHRVNLRCFVVKPISWKSPSFEIPSSIYLLWNLQTLIYSLITSTIEIWKMPLLRHVKFDHLYLPDPSNEIDFVLSNLQTLSNVVNFRCSEQMVKMIPNIKKLGISYDEKFEGSCYSLNNLEHLHELESLFCSFDSSIKPSQTDLAQNIIFPHSLKKLTLVASYLHWEDISMKIGSLPLLQVLKLREKSVVGPKWETLEGKFLCLKFLLIESSDLECWTSDSTHFPCLEHLVLNSLSTEIPLGFGEILTLQSIKLYFCSNSAIMSAKKIVDEQEQYGNENLQVRAISWKEDPILPGLASHNFQVIALPWWDLTALNNVRTWMKK